MMGLRRGLLLAGCAALVATAPAPSWAASLVVSTEASPNALNAQLSDANTSFDVSEQIADRLVEMRPGTSDVVPGLAESWTTSPGGMRITFKLRHGVKWQSNDRWRPTRDMNADDVVFSFNRVLDPANPFHTAAGGSYPMFDDYIAPAVKAVTKLSDDTVAFDLKAPSASLVSVLTVQSFSIWPAEYAAAMKAAGTPELLDDRPLGTGPFQLVQYQKDSLVRFRAFPEFWGAGPGGGPMAERAAKVDQLVFSITPDAAVRFAKLRAGECQVLRYPSPADLPAMRQTPGVVVVDAPIAAQSALAWRVDRKPFDDIRVREALTRAIDLPKLLDAVFQGSGVATASLVPSALWGHNGTLKPLGYDPDRARALLAEAGYKDGFTTDLWAIPVVRAYMPNGRRAAELIQADWARVGVKATIVSFEWGEYLRRRRAGEATVAMAGGTWDYPDPSELIVWQTCGAIASGSNISHWCDRTFSDLVAKADLVTDQAERARLYEQAQAIYARQMPGVLLADVRGFAAIRDSVQGFRLHFLGGQPFGGVSVK